MAKDKENKVILERVYVVPLRRKFLNTPQYKRANKAIKILKKFLAKHMKVADRDTDLIKLDRYLNEQMWFRGIRKPLPKVKVRAKKYEDGKVIVELADIPAYVKFKMEKDKKMIEKLGKRKVETEKKPETEQKSEEEKKEEQEKVSSTVEAGLQQQKEAAKQQKHQVQTQHQIKKPLARKALQK